MQNYNNSYTHTVPLFIKLFCSIFIWLPLFISFISVWYLKNITIIYNVIISLYVMISLSLTFATCLVTFMRQKQIIYIFFPSPEWNNMKNLFSKDRKHKLDKQGNIETILHLVILPIYKENLSVIDNTLQSLSQQNVEMIVNLALEEREIDSDTKYNNVIQKYEDKFLKIIKTIHPVSLKNEIPSKSSNCNYSAQKLVNYYEENFKDIYKYVMITVCDCDSIWCDDYFLYLNYLLVKNNLKYFDRIIYTPNITNFKDFQLNHILTNWMSIVRLISIHGHFRFLGYIRCFTSEYHIPLKLLKQIDYWDADLVHEDVHMCNKLAILNEISVIFKSTYLPCDNQTPTDPDSAYNSSMLLWNQSLRWNQFVYDIYYLVHQLILNLFKVKNYENFSISPWKTAIQIINNYENLFFHYWAPIFNGIFWILYVNLFNDHSDNDIIDFFLIYIQPCFIVIQTLILIPCILTAVNANDPTTKAQLYHGSKYFLLVTMVAFLPVLALSYQCINLTFAWIQTLKPTFHHSDATSKIILKSKEH